MATSLIAWTGVLLLLRTLLGRATGSAARVPVAGRLGSRLLNISIVLVVVAMTPLGANALVRWLERPAHTSVACAEEPDRSIVVLAGGLQRPVRRADDFEALAWDSTRRVFGLLQSGLAKPGRPVVFVGGDEPVGVAAVMGALASRADPTLTDVSIEPGSRTTWENARTLADRTAVRRIVLVTGALHMRRAAFSFERHGFDVCRLPVDSRYVSPGGIGYFVPQHSAVSKAEAALYELIGLIAYRLR